MKNKDLEKLKKEFQTVAESSRFGFEADSKEIWKWFKPRIEKQIKQAKIEAVEGFVNYLSKYLMQGVINDDEAETVFKASPLLDRKAKEYLKNLDKNKGFKKDGFDSYYGVTEMQI